MSRLNAQCAAKSIMQKVTAGDEAQEFLTRLDWQGNLDCRFGGAAFAARRIPQSDRGCWRSAPSAIPRLRINLAAPKTQIQSTGDDLPVGVPVLQNLQRRVSNRRWPRFSVSDGADDIRVGAFGFELLLDIRNEEVARFRDSSSEVDRFLAYLLVKRGAYKITRNPEDTADGDEEKRGVGEEDFVVEFDGLRVLSLEPVS